MAKQQNEKRISRTIPLILITALMAVTACSGEKEVVEGSLSASTTSFTPCKNSRADSNEDYTMTLKLSLKGSEVTGRFSNIVVPCDFKSIAVEASTDDTGTIVLTIAHDSEGAVNCICHSDCDFRLRGITAGTYRLRVQQHGVGAMAQNLPIYEDMLTIKDKQTIEISLDLQL